MMKFLFLGLILIISVLSCTNRQKVDYRHYDILTTAREISEFYNIPLDTSGTKEKTEIVKYIDNSCILKYTYNFIETNDFHPLFYSISIDKVGTTKDAIESFILSKTIFKTTNSAIGLTHTEIDTLSIQGDQIFYAIRNENNEPNGIFLIIRKKNMIYTLIMSGLYTADHSLLNDLVMPKIKKLETLIIKY